jgi:hypothetical protein
MKFHVDEDTPQSTLLGSDHPSCNTGLSTRSQCHTVSCNRRYIIVPNSPHYRLLYDVSDGREIKERISNVWYLSVHFLPSFFSRQVDLFLHFLFFSYHLLFFFLVISPIRLVSPKGTYRFV